MLKKKLKKIFTKKYSIISAGDAYMKVLPAIRRNC